MLLISSFLSIPCVPALPIGKRFCSMNWLECIDECKILLPMVASIDSF